MISIALPKGSLEDQTLKLFREADLEVRRGTGTTTRSSATTGSGR
jgi:ATP phosphoribosyltransferase